MANGFSIEIHTDWSQTASWRSQWQSLHQTMQDGHPFTAYDWFSWWYAAYCPPGAVRIVVVRKGGEVRAVLPGLLERRVLGGLPVNCFTYAANGHTPRGAILARPEDDDARQAAINALLTHLTPAPHLMVFPAVETTSATRNALLALEQSGLSLRVEHTFEASAFDISAGWDAYLSGKSYKTRRGLKHSLAQSQQRGEVAPHFFSAPSQHSELLDRLQPLDTKTWQGQNGTGLFSTPDNAAFYRRLLSLSSQEIPVFVCLLQLGGQDAAYAIAVCHEGTAFILKQGYDAQFASCRPGVITTAQMGTHAAELGLAEVDLGAGVNEDKSHWETHRRQFRNYWLIDNRALKGRGLVAMLRAHQLMTRRVAIDP